MRRVTFESVSDFFFEVVDNDEIREERQDIFDLEKIRVLQKPHGTGKTSQEIVKKLEY